LVETGKLPLTVVDTAVARVLRAKFAMGLFENPYQGVAASEFGKYINTPEHKQIARELDADSIVLLENHNAILPLKRDSKVAVIGPMAHGYVNVRFTPFNCTTAPS
jgi:beta-glucosidase